jgi:hypothetical protein
LQLTGPCRPIAWIDPVDFEIQLKVKGKTESEDETFMAQRFGYAHSFGQSGNLLRRRWVNFKKPPHYSAKFEKQSYFSEIAKNHRYCVGCL